MSKNEPPSLPSPEIHGFFVDAVTAKGGTFLQGDGKGQFHFEVNGAAYSVVITKPTAPLKDLSGKDKITKLEKPAE